MKDYTVLTYHQIEYICRQTNLIDKEVCRRHEHFLNRVQDGRMSREQLISVLNEIWPAGKVEKFAEHLFIAYDKNHKGFMEFTDFIILYCQLKDDKSYLGLLFDMFDTHHKGYLPREKLESLFAAMFELIGYSTDEQTSTKISQQQITHLIERVDKSKNKRLLRNQFMNITNTNWTDDDNGIGTLLVEHSC